MNTIQHGLQSLGALGVARPSEVIEVGSMSGEKHGHARRRYRPARGGEVPGTQQAATVAEVSSQPSCSTRHHDAGGTRGAGSSSLLLRGNEISCRVQHWSFQPQTAQLVLYHQQRLPTLADLQGWAERLAELGYTAVRTTALSGPAGLRMESAGFRPIQELVLLENTDPRKFARHHSRPSGATGQRSTTSRLTVAQHAKASDIDVAAFARDWALEPQAVAAVCTATPRHRARGAGSPLAAYAITGRDAQQGFLQRLAVAPSHQRAGLGHALVVDSLQWLARWRVQRVLVNTPTDNLAALALYERLGFQRLPEHLRLYERSLA